MEICDIVVRGGTIADGSGGEPWRGDVAIRGSRIAFVGAHFEGQAREEIDASGMIVTPGFVDIHTHYDGQAAWSEELSPSSSHGVTTVVIGNCGVGFAPCRAADRDALVEVMEGVEDIPGVVMADGLPWDWETFPEYLDALAARPRDIDIAAFLPHNPLRVYAMGERAIAREAANAEDLAAMQAITREAIEAGAIGFATSRLMIHKTLAGEQIPSFDAEMAELGAIAEAMRESGSGILQASLNVPFQSWHSELEPLLAIAEESRRPLTFTIGVSNAPGIDWREPLVMSEAARERGAEVHPQVLPRPAGMVMGWDLSTNPFCLCPSYRAIAQLPLEERLERLRDPALRDKLLAETPEPGLPLAMMTRSWDWTFPLGDPPIYEPGREASIAAIAAREGRSPEAVAFDLLMAGGSGTGLLLAALGNLRDGKLDVVLEMLERDDTVLGLGDGGAHYSAICDASYTTYMLGHWVRDRQGPRIPLGRAVRHLAAKPAQVVGLNDRGLLREGYKADVNVIDLERLRLHAPVIRRDLPGGGRRLDQTADGYVATICSGEVIRRHDRATGARPGQVVRGAQAAA